MSTSLFLMFSTIFPASSIHLYEAGAAGHHKHSLNGTILAEKLDAPITKEAVIPEAKKLNEKIAQSGSDVNVKAEINELKAKIAQSGSDVNAKADINELKV